MKDAIPASFNFSYFSFLDFDSGFDSDFDDVFDSDFDSGFESDFDSIFLESDLSAAELSALDELESEPPESPLRT
jgi:hypothetical protein